MKDIFKLPTHTVSAAAFIFNGNKLLLVHNPYKGWETPGGMIDEGESIIEGLKREIIEECQLEVDVKCLSCVTSIVNKQKGYNGIDVIQPLVVFDFICECNTEIVILSNEHDDYCWVEFNQVKDVIKKDLIFRFESTFNQNIDFFKCRKESTVSVLDHIRIGE